MSQTLHVDPDLLYLTARRLWQEHLQLADQAYSLRVEINRLEMAWQGGTAEEHIYALRLLLNQLNQKTEELMKFALILSRQAVFWEESDQRWTLVFRELSKGS